MQNSFWVVMHGGCVAGYYWVYLTFLASIVTNWWGAHFPWCQILHVFISQKRTGCAQNHPTRSMNVSQLHFRTGPLRTIRIILLSNSCHFIFISLSGAKLIFFGQNWSTKRAFSVPDICFFILEWCDSGRWRSQLNSWWHFHFYPFTDADNFAIAHYACVTTTR